MHDDYISMKKADFSALYDHLCATLTEWEENPNETSLYAAMVELQGMFDQLEYE